MTYAVRLVGWKLSTDVHLGGTTTMLEVYPNVAYPSMVLDIATFSTDCADLLHPFGAAYPDVCTTVTPTQYTTASIVSTSDQRDVTIGMPPGMMTPLSVSIMKAYLAAMYAPEGTITYAGDLFAGLARVARMVFRPTLNQHILTFGIEQSVSTLVPPNNNVVVCGFDGQPLVTAASVALAGITFEVQASSMTQPRLVMFGNVPFFSIFGLASFLSRYLDAKLSEQQMKISYFNPNLVELTVKLSNLTEASIDVKKNGSFSFLIMENYVSGTYVATPSITTNVVMTIF